MIMSTLLTRYLSSRPSVNGPLFVDSQGNMLTRYAISTVLNNVIAAIGLDPIYYNCHSFRIGRTTDLFRWNCSDEIIRRSGRWVTDAWKTYIKPAYVVVE